MTLFLFFRFFFYIHDIQALSLELAALAIMYKSDLKNKNTLVGSGFQRNKAWIPISVLLYIFVAEILALK